MTLNIYIIKCVQDKYYVGITSRKVQNRFDEHKSGGDRAAKWTKKYSPIEIIKSWEISEEHRYLEDEITIRMMKIYGIDNVRGGSFCSVNFEWDEKHFLKFLIEGTVDFTYKINEEYIRRIFYNAANTCEECGNEKKPDHKCYEKDRFKILKLSDDLSNMIKSMKIVKYITLSSFFNILNKSLNIVYTFSSLSIYFKIKSSLKNLEYDKLLIEFQKFREPLIKDDCLHFPVGETCDKIKSVSDNDHDIQCMESPIQEHQESINHNMGMNDNSSHRSTPPSVTRNVPTFVASLYNPVTTPTLTIIKNDSEEDIIANIVFNCYDGYTIYDYENEVKNKIYSDRYTAILGMSMMLNKCVRKILGENAYIIKLPEGIVKKYCTYRKLVSYLMDSYVKYQSGVDKNNNPEYEEISIYEPLKQEFNAVRGTFVQPYLNNEDPPRKQYYINVFQGYQAKIVPFTGGMISDINIWLYHIKEVICGGNDVYFNYLMSYYRHILKTGMKSNICVALLGGQGVGKTIFVDDFMSGLIFGEKLAVTDLRLETFTTAGRFNSVLDDKMMGIIPELSSVDTLKSRRTNFDILKGIITGNYLTINKKFVQEQSKKSFINIVITSNHLNSLLIEGDDRRFFVLYVTFPENINKDTYFQALKKGLNQDTANKFLTFLVTDEWKKYDFNFDMDIIDELPKTEIKEQISELSENIVETFERYLLEGRKHLSVYDLVTNTKSNTKIYKKVGIYSENLTNIINEFQRELTGGSYKHTEASVNSLAMNIKNLVRPKDGKLLGTRRGYIIPEHLYGQILVENPKSPSPGSIPEIITLKQYYDSIYHT